MRTIFLDPGHGDRNQTAGKRSPIFPAGHQLAGQRLYEGESNLEMANRIKPLLEYNGFNVVMSRTDGTDVSLATRVSKANSISADLFVSLHSDAVGDGETWMSANGTTTFVYSTGLAVTKLADLMVDGVSASVGTYNRGYKAADFYVLRETNMDAVLVEMFFHTNLDEATKAALDKDWRQKIAVAIAKSICQYYGQVYKEKVLTNPITHTVANGDTLYGISRKYNVTVSEIQQRNGMGSSTTIYAGQVLDIRDRPASGYYRVRKSWADAGSQVGAFTIFEGARDKANSLTGYNVYYEGGILYYVGN